MRRAVGPSPSIVMVGTAMTGACKPLFQAASYSAAFGKAHSASGNYGLRADMIRIVEGTPPSDSKGASQNSIFAEAICQISFANRAVFS